MADYLIAFGVDSSAFTKGFQEMAETTDKLAETAEAAGERVKNSFKNSTDANEKLVKSISENIKTVNKAFDEKPVNRFTTFIQRARDTVLSFSSGVKEGVTDALKKAEIQANQTTAAIADKPGGLIGVLKSIGGALSGFFAFAGITELVRQIFGIRSEFVKFEAVLTSTLGDRSEAQKAMRQIVDFATKTPFQVDELTASFVKLANRGFIPTMQELTKMGDLAASQGKTFDQLTEAVLDAQTGEFERLKEFGIRAKQSGDTVSLSFGGVTKEVNKSEAAIRGAILSFGELPQVAGGMETVSKTIGGQFSNLKDSAAQLLNVMGEKLEPVFSALISGASSFINFFSDVFNNKAPAAVTVLIEGFRTLFEGIKTVVGAVAEFTGVSISLSEVGEIFSKIAQAVGVVVGGLGQALNALASFGDQTQKSLKPAAGIFDTIKKGFNILLADIIQLPYELRGIGAAIGKFVQNAVNDFVILGNNAKASALSIKSAFTFNDNDKKAIADRISALNKENDHIKATRITPGQAYDRSYQLSKKEAEGAINARKEAQKKQEEAEKRANEGQVKSRFNTAQQSVNTKASENAIKAIEKENKIREQHDRDRVEAEKRFLDLVNQRRQIELDAIEDVNERQIEASRQQLNQRLDALAIEESRLKTRNDKKGIGSDEVDINKKSLEEIGRVRENLKLAQVKKEALINAAAAKERFELEFTAEQVINELQKDSVNKSLESIDLETKGKLLKVSEQYKNESQLRTRLEGAILKEAERSRKETIDKSQLDQLEKDERIQIMSIETAVKYAGDTVKIEEQKQLAILETQKHFAELRLTALISQGKTETDESVLQAEKELKDLTESVNNAKKELQAKGKVFNLREMIFGDMSDKNGQAIDKALQASLESVATLTDFITDQYQRQIDKKQELIDADKKAVEDLEKQLDKEKDLRDQGLANNVDALQRELDEKKAIRDQDMKDQQDLIEQQNNARRAQLVIDSITQASNLITAATEIFAALAGIPFIGIPLAITTISLMGAAFVAAKVKAFQMVGEGQKFGDGGYIDGPAHTEGGKKYRSVDGSGEVLELEGGEFVTKKKAVSKYGDLLEAINSDQISRMSDAGLKEMLGSMGIHFDTGEERESVNLAREHEELKAVVVINDTKEELKSIAGNMAFLAEQARSKTERWEDSEYEYIKQGNKLTRIKK